MTHSHYKGLILMIVLSFLAMYGLMYAMVDIIANVFTNYNQLYMAGLMTASMVIIEIILMGSMYPNKKLNTVIFMVSITFLFVFWFLIRNQTAILDKQFLRSMIPHHGGAILMCNKATIHDPEIVDLCKNIISGQQREIDQMKNILNRLKNDQ